MMAWQRSVSPSALGTVLVLVLVLVLVSTMGLKLAKVTLAQGLVLLRRVAVVRRWFESLWRSALTMSNQPRATVWEGAGAR